MLFVTFVKELLTHGTCVPTAAVGPPPQWHDPHAAPAPTCTPQTHRHASRSSPDSLGARRPTSACHARTLGGRTATARNPTASAAHIAPARATAAPARRAAIGTLVGAVDAAAALLGAQLVERMLPTEHAEEVGRERRSEAVEIESQ
jgi:hypothetical protein